MRTRPLRDTHNLRHYLHHSRTNSTRCLYVQPSSNTLNTTNNNLSSTSNKCLHTCLPNNILRNTPLINNLCLRNLLLLKTFLVTLSTSVYQQLFPRVQLLQFRRTLKRNISCTSSPNLWSLKSIRR